MANVWNGMTFTNIARTGFRAFNAKLISLAGFTTDFSADASTQGTTVSTRIVPVSGAAVDLQSGTVVAGSREDANIHAGETTTAVSVTLNQQPIAGFALTDEEAMLIGAGVWQDTKTKLIQQKGFAVANSILNYVFDLIINANFGAAIFTGAANTFDMDEVVNLARDLVATHKWDLDNPTHLALQPAYIAELKKDNAIQDLSASGIEVVQTGKLYQLDRFTLVEAPTLPPAGGTAAGEYLVGFVSQPSAIAIAMRQVASQSPDKLMAYEVMTDPQTGATLVYRAWYNEAFGKVFHTFEALYGAAKGQTEALKRLVSQ